MNIFRNNGLSDSFKTKFETHYMGRRDTDFEPRHSENKLCVENAMILGCS